MSYANPFCCNRVRAVAVVAVLAAPVSLSADTLLALNTAQLADLSLEALMSIEVFSASKRREPLQQTATAIHVLTAEDIERAGVKSVAEALRLVPGLIVARSDAHTWVVAARGFSADLMDKLEVQMDGRSLYTPLFSGVYWQMHNILMEDIERIEVIRGPGAALWGANSVNGVINIVTKSATDTPGSMVQAGGGDNIQGYGAARTTIDAGKGHIRFYGKSDYYSDQELANGDDAHDKYEAHRAGFRSDWRLNDRQSLTVQGEAYRDRIDQDGTAKKETNQEDYLLGRWSHRGNADRTLEIQLYYDRTEKAIPEVFVEDREVADLDIRYSTPLGQRHHVVLGGGYNYTSDEIDAPDLNLLTFRPDKRSDETYNFYVQDQYNYIPDKLRFTAGVKFEHNDYSGTEFQPSIRVSFTPNEDSTYWGAVSRAVRIPTRLDEDFVIFLPAPFPPDTPIIVGSDDFDSEEVVAYEAGYRTLLTDTLSLDMAVYYNDYDQLRGVNNSVTPALISNEGEGEGSGVETALRWRPNDKVGVLASYSYLHLDIDPVSGSTDTSIEGSDRNDPRHQGMLQVNWMAAQSLDMSFRLRNVSELPDRGVEGYTELDANLNWRPLQSLELSVLGQNLLDGSHPEFSSGSASSGFRTVEVGRSLVLSATWRM